MRRVSGQIVAVLALSLALGCGDFDNDALKVARVIGTVHGAVKSQSLVMCRERPESRDEPAEHEDGAFEVEVPVGDSELFVVASNDLAARVPVLQAKAGEVRNIGAVDPLGAGRFEIEIHVSGGVHLEGITATVVGTPYANMPVDANNEVTLSPMAAGPYTVTAHVPGFDDQTRDVSVAEAGETEIEFFFDLDASGNEARCYEHSCTNGWVCNDDGRCVSPTGSGSNVCGACTEDYECGTGQCRSVGNGMRACFALCGPNGACPSGFRCDPFEEICAPDGAGIVDCGHYRNIGASCLDDGSCQAEIGTHGLCATAGSSAGTCTVSCALDSDCPEGSVCEPDGAARACHPGP